jgi:hypothetical protein
VGYLLRHVSQAIILSNQRVQTALPVTAEAAVRGVAVDTVVVVVIAVAEVGVVAAEAVVEDGSKSFPFRPLIIRPEQTLNEHTTIPGNRSCYRGFFDHWAI